MSQKKINYTSRNFGEVRTDLINLIKQYYPNLLSDFNDASIASVFIDLNAAVTDLLSHHTDRMYQETQLDYAQQRNSILNIARTMGYKVVGKRPSVTICDFTVTVPTLGSTYDESYLPLVRRGTQVSGSGKVFELYDDVDFKNPFTIGGVPNRLIQPNIDSSGAVISYDITKREVVRNGQSKIMKKVLTIDDTKPFKTITLSDPNVMSVESVIVLEGTNHNEIDNTKFYDHDLRWYEMESLVEDKIFVENPLINVDSDLKVGKWISTSNKFITEYTGNGYMRLTFGGGEVDLSNIFKLNSDNNNINDIQLEQIGDIVNNNALGNKLSAGNTLFIKYVVGGGDDTNIGSNVLTNVSYADIYVGGSNSAINSAVKSSLRVNNPIPALGGRNEPTIEEIRQSIKMNFASQNRAVTLKDYQAIISKMDGKFGAPFRYGVMETGNKIVVNVLSKNAENQLTDSISSVLKNNITEYLSNYRMINDYVVVKAGKIINLGVDVDLMLEKNVSQSVVIGTVIQKIVEYFDVNKFQMGDNVYISNLIENINNVNGVLNVVNIKFINKTGNGYSNAVSSQSVLEDGVNVIDYSADYTLYNEINSIFEIKNPRTDIRVRVK